MGKISDEIRELINDEDLYPRYIAELRRIADRIDAEIVELPKSADGKIWTGREACFWTNDTDEGYHQFDSLIWRNGIWFVEDIHNTAYTAESVSYERPDSFERIADELDKMVDVADSTDDRCERLADLAERIRKLAAKEG